MVYFPIDVIGLILYYVDPDLRDLLNYKRVCKQFWQALNSSKLSYLYHHKYYKWFQSAKRGSAKRILRETKMRSRQHWNDLLWCYISLDGVIDGPPRYRTPYERPVKRGP